MMNFNEKLLNICHKNNSLLCVGLDIDADKIPEYLWDESKNPFLEFNETVIDETKDLVCAYKLNLAFYEALDDAGWDLLRKTLEHIPDKIIVILDGKRNDIGNTAKKYAEAFYEVLDADAVTINPYLGEDGIYPFLEYEDKCSFILCRTSNPSAVDFQNLICDGKPLYHKVAEKIQEWNKKDQCGAVVGATYPEELQNIRSILSDDIPFLIPGVGKQGGDVEKTVKYGTNSKNEFAIINSSRGVIYAGKDEHFGDDVRSAAESLQKMINKYR